MAISRSDMERQLRNMGGIMSLQEPRQGYFLGKLVKKAKRAVKKVAKSPVGKLGLLAAGAGLLGGVGPFAGLKTSGLGSFLMGAKGPPGLAKTGILQKFFLKNPGAGFSLGNLLGKGLTTKGLAAGIAGLSGLGGLMAARGQEEEDDEQDILDRGEGLDIDRIVRLAKMNDPQFRFLPPSEFTGAYAEGGEVNLEKDPEYKGWKKIYMMSPDAAESHPKHTEFENYLNPHLYQECPVRHPPLLVL